jgi:hypothetical protein
MLTLFDDKLRRTGRTTRMLEEAKKLAEGGRAVYIVAANKKHQLQLAKLLGDGNPYSCVSGIKVETENSLSNFDWETLSLKGAHPNCVVFVDHFAIEEKLSRVLRPFRKAIEEINKY